MELLDKKLQRRVGIASKKLGFSEREVVSRAISTYLWNMSDVAALSRELQIWDVLSARTMQKYKF
ncbi:MAG: hypothetical protein AAB794_00795 [Patescibacteria group bacterium]